EILANPPAPISPPFHSRRRTIARAQSPGRPPIQQVTQVTDPSTDFWQDPRFWTGARNETPVTHFGPHEGIVVRRGKFLSTSHPERGALSIPEVASALGVEEYHLRLWLSKHLVRRGAIQAPEANLGNSWLIRLSRRDPSSVRIGYSDRHTRCWQCSVAL